MRKRRSKRSMAKWWVAGPSRLMKVRIVEVRREVVVVPEVHAAEGDSMAPVGVAIEMARERAAIEMAHEGAAIAMAVAIAPEPNATAVVSTVGATMISVDPFVKLSRMAADHQTEAAVGTAVAVAPTVVAKVAAAKDVAAKDAAVDAADAPAAVVATSCHHPISCLKTLCAKAETAVVAVEKIRARNDTATTSMMIGRAS